MAREIPGVRGNKGPDISKLIVCYEEGPGLFTISGLCIVLAALLALLFLS
jgi:hypothetical protein